VTVLKAAASFCRSTTCCMHGLQPGPIETYRSTGLPGVIGERDPLPFGGLERERRSRLPTWIGPSRPKLGVAALRPHAEATKAKLVTMIQLRRFIR
jgi:hypothetical protein